METTVIYRDDVLANLARNMASLMDRDGYGVRELARVADVDPMQVSRLMREERLPSVDVIARIAEALDSTVDALIAKKTK